jgi:prophage tail gpP-like protein
MADAPKSDVRIEIRGEELTNAIDYAIESNMLKTSDSFHFVVANPRGRWSGEFHELDEVKVYVDGSLQMSGYIDDITTGADATSGPTLEIVGRDRFGQLVDGSSPPRHFNNKHLADIARELSAPFVDTWIYDNELNRKRQQSQRKKIARNAPFTEAEKTRRLNKRNALASVATSISTGIASIDNQSALQIAALALVDIEAQEQLEASVSRAKNVRIAQANLARIKRENFPRVKVEPGESPMEVIVRYAKKVGVMVWQAADGSGVLARPNYNQPPAGNIWFYDKTNPDSVKNNAISSSVTRTARDRYATYRLLGYSANNKNTSGTGSRYDESLSDDGITLDGRDLVVARATGQSVRQAKAELERDMQRRKYGALTADYTVRGHTQMVDGERNLWTVDTLCNVDDEINNVKETLYVVRRRFTGGLAGQRTELTMGRVGVLLPS